MAGQWSVIVIGDRSAEYSRESITELLADDTTELAHRPSHGRQRRLKPRNRLFRLESSNEPCRVDDVGPENCHKSSFAVGINTLANRSSAFGAPSIARIDLRLTCEAMHSCAFKGRIIVHG
jgi:hypothetical protein